MSNAWAHEALTGATAVPIWTRPITPRFTARPPGAPGGGFSAWATEPAIEPEPIYAPEPEPVRDFEAELDAIRADAFAQGFEAGARTEREMVAQERAALARLAGSLENFRPEPIGDLARLLAESVSRLVRQVCGEVEADPALMVDRTTAIAAMIGEESGPARLRLHPADCERLKEATLPLPIVADPTLHEGTIMAETAAGWIEDGPAIRMEKLRGLLEAMGLGR